MDAPRPSDVILGMYSQFSEVLLRVGCYVTDNNTATLLTTRYSTDAYAGQVGEIGKLLYVIGILDRYP